MGAQSAQELADLAGIGGAIQAIAKPVAADTADHEANQRGKAMPKIALSDITTWITEAAQASPLGLTRHLADRLGVGRASARKVLRQLVDSQWLLRSGPACRPIYHPGTMRQVVRRYALAGLQEDLPWANEFAPRLHLPPSVARMAQHCFTELLNNAVDHSGGTQVVVSARQTPDRKSTRLNSSHG